MSEVKAPENRAIDAAERIGAAEIATQQIFHRLGAALDRLRDILNLQDPQVRDALPSLLELEPSQVVLRDPTAAFASPHITKAWVHAVGLSVGDDKKLTVRIQYGGHEFGESSPHLRSHHLTPEELVKSRLNTKPAVAEAIGKQLNTLANNLEELATKREAAVARAGAVA